ncbi:hydroxymethylbilane synthase [Desulfonatronum sp. SC1]|uniref:hydroxymethylbilane synthase n=1 Tax=Desulfonatronum sp. SC1 TaxID=2109626 RepID=UPI0018EE4AE4|nr:hydroxymethylbilane synthase [Desulfonatronum sp. SC1]
MLERITIASRGSKLALWQAEHVKSRLLERYPGLEVELLLVKTMGDKIQDVPLAKVGGKGLFVKEIEEALLDGRADLAVHSMKDVPAELPEGLVLGVIPEREDLTDALLSVLYDGLDGLPEGARVGTSSLRRRCQLLALRPDLKILNLRGNLDTRVNKLLAGDYDAIIVAQAGMNRLGLSVPKSTPLGPPLFLPAVGQGALGLEYAQDREDLVELLGFLNHPDTHCCVRAERAFLATLEGGCQVPIAGYAHISAPNRITLRGLVADVDGKTLIIEEATDKPRDAEELGRRVARAILDRGGREILAEVYGA